MPAKLHLKKGAQICVLLLQVASLDICLTEPRSLEALKPRSLEVSRLPSCFGGNGEAKSLKCAEYWRGLTADAADLRTQKHLILEYFKLCGRRVYSSYVTAHRTD